MQGHDNAPEQQGPVDAVRQEGPAQPPAQPGEQAEAPQNGAVQPPAQAGEQAAGGAGAVDALPADEREEDEKDEKSHQAEQEGPEPAEADRQRKRLEEARAQQEQQIKSQEKNRFIEFSKSGISLQPLDENRKDARKEDQLFVAPRDYQRFVDEIREDTGKHILIVAGKESSGKLMTAFHLARHTWENKELEYYRFRAQGNRTLLDIWADENLPENAVILFDEVFNKEQTALDDLTNRYVHLNERLAAKNNIWFIFTVLEGPILDRLRDTGSFPILSTAPVDRRQVLEKLIDYHFPEDSHFEKQRARLLSVEGELPSPARLSQLFETQSNLDVIYQGLSQKEEQPQEAPEDWFSQLTPMNYQLYALLAVLFDRLDIPTLEEIYTLAVHALRRQGMDGPDEFIDPRRIRTNLMHTWLGIQVRYNMLEFRNRSYRQYVEAQVEHYQRLLWSLIDPDDPSTFEGLVGLIRHLSEIDAQLMSRGEKNERTATSLDPSRQLRYAIAVMIARVGVYHQTKLYMLLEKLVQDESALVALTAAQVLAEIARRGGHFDYIERVLRTWIYSGRFTQMWAAAPGIAFIYNAIAGSLEEERAAQEADEQDEADRENLAGDEESKGKTAEEQKKRGRGYLARLRDMLTELVKVHKDFSKESIDEASNVFLRLYLTGLQQFYEESSEPLTEKDGRLFRELTEGDKRRFLLSAYTESKKDIDEAVKRDIGVLKNSWLNQMRMVLVQTLEHIMQMWPRDVTRLVRTWLDRKNPEGLLWEIGHMGLNYLFQQSIAIKDPSVIERAAYPLLDLIPLAMRTHTLTLESVLQTVHLALHIEDLEESMTLEQHLEVGDLLGGDSLVYALVALQQWYEHLGQPPTRQEKKGAKPAAEEDEDEEEDKEQHNSEAETALRQNWQEQVSAVLANAMNNAPQEERQRLRRALTIWVKTGDKVLSRIARILISHAYVMDGIVLDLPISRRAGLVVIDSQRREPEDRERVFILLQNLSAIVPVHLHWLGYTRSRRLLQSDHRDESAQAEKRAASFGPDDLLLRSASRPGLLMPILQPGQGQAYIPDQTYFVVVFHTGVILDLAELYPGLGATREQREKNIFLEYIERQQVAAQASSQPWQGKVYLQSIEKAPGVPDSLAPLLTVVRPKSLVTLEGELRKRVAITLRARPATELWQELRQCIGGPVPHAPAVARLAEEIEHWLEQLADTKTLYPDVSLFILWTVMVRSLENLAEARQLVELMLQEPGETSTAHQGRQAEQEAKQARKLRQQMGIACTRMLFHFYGAENPTLPVEPYGELLHLLPQMMARASSASEIVPVLAILFELVRDEHWLHIVNDDEGSFFESIQKVPLKELDLLRRWVKNYQHLMALSRLFLELNRPFQDFVDLGDEVYRRYRTSRARRPIRGAAPLPPTETDSKFLAVLPAENNAEEQDRYAWALQQLEFQQASFRKPENGGAVLAGLRNQEVLLNHLTNEMQRRQDGTIERLKEGNFYGVVLVEAGNKDAVHQTFLFVQEFVKQRRQHKEQPVTLMLQRLGENELLAKIRTNWKIKEREIGDKRQLPQLIGPLLERYPADQVAFVLLITALPVLDYDDWVEQDDWARRLWLVSLDTWQPYRGNMVALGESTPLILETILNTSRGERATL